MCSTHSSVVGEQSVGPFTAKRHRTGRKSGRRGGQVFDGLNRRMYDADHDRGAAGWLCELVDRDDAAQVRGRVVWVVDQFAMGVF